MLSRWSVRQDIKYDVWRVVEDATHQVVCRECLSKEHAEEIAGSHNARVA